jgi:hypothetical protein
MSQLTLAWAVNQSRRVFKAKKKQVHPEDVSSAGTDGGGSPYDTAHRWERRAAER